MQFRDLPSVEKVLSTGPVRSLLGQYQRDWIVNLVREGIGEARNRVRNGHGTPSLEEIAAWVEARVQTAGQVWPTPVINATGVIIHTNLGRAPLSEEAMEAMLRVARGYSNLELDLEEGKRGSRQAHIQPLLRQLTGAEAGLVVNNNASAVLLGLAALARGGEVIVSRGEAVEIGGGFRIPDVMAQGGATLVEVGTTNRTYGADYVAAITERTAAILKVHASNFRVTGFTHAAEIGELAELGRQHKLPVLHDIGSGCLFNTEAFGLAHEPTPQESIKAGAGVVFFSGDKLLGGPQAGIVVGQKELVQKLERHPLARAVRIDKISMAALATTLMHYVKGEAQQKVPVWRMLSASADELKGRASAWQAQVGDRSTILSSLSTIGGGSLPGETLPTWVLALHCDGLPGGVEEVMRRLRWHSPPVIARIEGERVVLDPRTVLPDEEDDLLHAVKEALSQA